MSIIFENVWTWLGTVILVVAALNGVADIIKAIKDPRRKITINKLPGGSTFTEFTFKGVNDFTAVSRKIIEENFTGKPGQKEGEA